MNPFNNKWLALVLVAGVLLVVSELVGSPGNEGVLARFGVAESADPSAQAAQSEPTVVADAPTVIEDEPADPSEEDEEALDDADAAEAEVIDEQVFDVAEADASDPVAAGSTVASQPPGPPGVFDSGE